MVYGHLSGGLNSHKTLMKRELTTEERTGTGHHPRNNLCSSLWLLCCVISYRH